MEILCWLVQAYIIAVLAWVVLSWVRVPVTHPLARVTTALDRIIYPVVLPLRKLIPPLRMGGVALDLSPLILIFVLSLLRGALCR